MAYYRVFTTEENGSVNTSCFKSNNTIDDAKAEYLAKRYMQSIKGFKTPMPIEVTLEHGH